MTAKTFALDNIRTAKIRFPVIFKRLTDAPMGV